MAIGGPGEDIQVRIGVTLQGAQEGRRTLDAAEPRARKLEAKTKDISRQLDISDRRLRAVPKGLLKVVAKGVVAGALTDGIEDLTGNSDMNAIAGLRTLGTNVAVQSLFMGLRMGPYIGIILTGLQGARAAISAIQERQKEERDRFDKLKDAVKNIDERFKQRLSDISDEFEGNVAQIRKRTYLELRTPRH